LDITDLLLRIVKSSDGKGFELKDDGCFVSTVFTVETSNVPQTVSSQDFLSHCDRLVVDGVQSTVVTSTDHAVLDHVLDFVTEGIVVLCGPRNLSTFDTSGGSLLLANHDQARSGTVVTERSLSTTFTIDTDADASSFGCHSETIVTLMVGSASLSGLTKSQSAESGESESSEYFFHVWFGFVLYLYSTTEKGACKHVL
jgi:hypothetical protein